MVIASFSGSLAQRAKDFLALSGSSPPAHTETIAPRAAAPSIESFSYLSNEREFRKIIRETR
jgi:hypothetical protein